MILDNRSKLDEEAACNRCEEEEKGKCLLQEKEKKQEKVVAAVSR
jgi:hypothetical protein